MLPGTIKKPINPLNHPNFLTKESLTKKYTLAKTTKALPDYQETLEELKLLFTEFIAYFPQYTANQELKWNAAATAIDNNFLAWCTIKVTNSLGLKERHQLAQQLIEPLVHSLKIKYSFKINAQTKLCEGINLWIPNLELLTEENIKKAKDNFKNRHFYRSYEKKDFSFIKKVDASFAPNVECLTPAEIRMKAVEVNKKLNQTKGKCTTGTTFFEGQMQENINRLSIHGKETHEVHKFLDITFDLKKEFSKKHNIAVALGSTLKPSSLLNEIIINEMARDKISDEVKSTSEASYRTSHYIFDELTRRFKEMSKPSDVLAHLIIAFDSYLDSYELRKKGMHGNNFEGIIKLKPNQPINNIECEYGFFKVDSEHNQLTFDLNAIANYRDRVENGARYVIQQILERVIQSDSPQNTI